MSGKDKQETTFAKKHFIMTPFSEPSFYQGDRQTYRRVAIVGALFCLAFVVISFSLRPQLEDTRVAVKADRLVRTAGQAAHAN
ncbi:hypothetical protein ABH991_005343 [Bradyrhizobium ottawaense]|uniref:Uncharacterized protein n=2 Tax=Nitrobacteraceae TaxID=41294 RepID=A0ABV4G2K9_9BRAD|nr:hypothetical protein SG09_54760 [Bradyrhizobium ottawaense]GMO18682.1 hypothetical protein BwSH14_10590 [Bradyrhizobium ottawaense]GMO19875.1 hypothetical protein BwSF21_13070 [Bradyrhizobium ottawaense]GMO42013.1 hypothetical protein BwSF12_45410 [Bradyrhizobium ottawaense]GMO54779.1 hypothetical protein BwSG20_01980 [Bradyrhizobium ottawaense]